VEVISILPQRQQQMELTSHLKAPPALTSGKGSTILEWQWSVQCNQLLQRYP